MTVSTPFKARANYFVRHWRGDLPLQISYWINMVCMGLLLVFLAVLIVLIGGLSRSAAIMLIAFYSLNIALIVWGGVGVWRSATNYQTAGGPPAWAILAKIAVGVAAIMTAMNLSGEGGLPLIARLLEN